MRQTSNLRFSKMVIIGSSMEENGGRQVTLLLHSTKQLVIVTFAPEGNCGFFCLARVCRGEGSKFHNQSNDLYSVINAVI